ncbi:hypothetical protein [Pseudogemmobacter blasticus]|uniref:Glycosyltransferase n=1 Tax=Fuscovulum blasticum DSM 2131 TaxID=1188250 RepID=A0A2T4J8S5_FUSBL|nr:hypothetical protein [Fuscovulum blasticum]PTE14294.1 hypothetical protein C5F44_09860 [Fuscovulum blasticum DSM 2131]
MTEIPRHDPDRLAPRVCLALPTMGQVQTPTLQSIIGLTQAFTRAAIPFAVLDFSFSDIVMSRNILASRFVADRTFTHMVMLDSDMVFAPQAILRLLRFDAPFTGCAYPMRRYDGDRLRAAFAASPAEADFQTVQSRAAVHVDYFRRRDGKPLDPELRDGFVRVAAMPAGMLCLHRLVLEGLIAAGEAPRLPGMERNGLAPAGVPVHDFFSHIRDDQTLYSEDISLAMRWQERLGGEIWMDTTQMVGHRGPMTVWGRFSDTLP